MSADLRDVAADRQLYLAAAGLALLGVVVLVMTIWWWRSTRPEPPALASLETMTTKKWRRADEMERHELLTKAKVAQPVLRPGDDGMGREHLDGVVDDGDGDSQGVGDADVDGVAGFGGDEPLPGRAPSSQQELRIAPPVVDGPDSASDVAAVFAAAGAPDDRSASGVGQPSESAQDSDHVRDAGWPRDSGVSAAPNPPGGAPGAVPVVPPSVADGVLDWLVKSAPEQPDDAEAMPGAGWRLFDEDPSGRQGGRGYRDGHG